MKNSLTLVAISLITVSACRERNPAYIDKVPPQDASGLSDAPADGTSPDARADALADLAPPPGDARDVVLPPPDSGLDQGADLSDVLLPRDVADARDARDVPDLRKPDDVADVSLPDVVASDARDLVWRPEVDRDVPPLLPDLALDTGAVDGTGIDGAPSCTEGAKIACAAASNPQIGACRAGERLCSEGMWGECVGEVTRAEKEVCGNGTDDDCNGMTDDGCLEDCIVVAQAASVEPPDGSPQRPFARLTDALALAADVDGGGARRVCVAASTCSASDVAAAEAQVFDTSLVIPNGVRVQGNYALQAGVLTYCAGVAPPVTTLGFTAAGAAVTFGDEVSTPTELGGFVIQRYAPAAGAATDVPSVAVAVRGAKHVVLSGLFVTDAPGGEVSYGVLIEGGGQATLTASSIGGGAGRTSAVGVYVDGGGLMLRDNCDELERGNCSKSCGSGVLGIRGRNGAAGQPAAGSSAVHVAAGSSASTIVGNLLCGGAGASEALAAAVATVRCAGGACASVAGNAIEAGGGRYSIGLAMTNGGGVIERNRIASGCGNEGSVGVLLEAAEARLQNNRIVPSTCAGSAGGALFDGVRIALGSGGEPDLHSNYINPGGNAGECLSRGIDVARQGGAGASGILRNNIVFAGNCKTRTAVHEGESAMLRLIENNDLFAEPATIGFTPTTVLVHRAGLDATAVAEVNLLDGARDNVSDDPKFVSYPDDLHLRTADSVCVDHGTPAGAPDTDADGRRRPQIMGFDIGPYELGSLLSP